MTTQELPAGWVWTTLGELGTWHGGGTPSKKNPNFWESGTIPWVSPKDMSKNVLTETQDHITDAAVAGSPTKVIPENSVVIVVRSGILARRVPVALVPFVATLNQDMKAIAPNAAVDPKWLLHMLQSQEQTIMNGCRRAGTTVASLDTAKLQGLPVALPPLTEQHRIVKTLERQLSNLDAAETNVRSIISKAPILASRIHRESLSRVADAKLLTIRELAKVGSGATPLRSNRKYYDNGTIPWTTSGDLHAGDIFDVDGRITEEALRETAVKLWPKGTLLVAMYGEGKTRGTVAELHIPSTTNQACAAIVLRPEFSHLKTWIKFILRTRYEEMRFQGSGGVQKNLSLGRIKGISIPIPDFYSREAILTEDRDNTESINRLQSAGVQALARSTALRRSLLRMAFNGDLVDQDPGDQPAAVALAKLHAPESDAKPQRRRKAVPAR